MTKIKLIALSFSLLVSSLAVQGYAQEPGHPVEASVEKKPLPPGFEPVVGGRPETVDANQLVVGAYAMFFVVLFGYLIYIARGQALLAKELIELRGRIEKLGQDRR